MTSGNGTGTSDVFSRIDTTTVAQLIARAGSAGYESWWAKVSGSGFCASPVHLTGHGSDGQPVGVLGRCKNRRAAVCPSCSDLYAGDTWQLVHTGITPAAPAANGAELTATGHPMVFATLTAPSFGAVHTVHRDAQGPSRRCRPLPVYRRCPHGQPAWCTSAHDRDDPRLGEPICPCCYDYPGQVLFTWHAPQLWHRFTITLRRLIRRRLRTLGEDPTAVRVSYVKVVELQRRGVAHFHTVIRLDNADTPAGEAPHAPDTAITATDLAVLTEQAAAAVHLDVPGPGGELVRLEFGEQADAQPIQPAAGTAEDAGNPSRQQPRTGRRVAGYLAKYVTKSVAEFGLSARRLSVQAIDRLDLRPHIRTVLQTIAELADEPGRAEMGRWLHTLGYRGHITTKTRRYSTTMGALRARREAWRRSTTRPEHGSSVEDSRRPVDDRGGAVEWAFTGYGHASNGDRLLALSAAARARENRSAARAAIADDLAGAA